MPTLKQKRAVRNLLGNVRNKKAALMDAGYSEKAAEQPSRVLESKGYKEAAKPFVEQMEAERQRLMDSLRVKNLDSVVYKDHVSALDTLTKNIQLLSGKNTEKIEVNTVRLQEIEKALDDL